MEFAGNLGYFGFSKNPEYNEKVKQANLLVDEYNKNVHSYKSKNEQMAYQFEMLKKMYEVLGKGEHNTYREKEFVVLEHLLLPDRGKRFWTTNSNNNTHSTDGELWYKEILFTDSTEEAINESSKCNVDALPTFNELSEYYLSQLKNV